MTYHQLELENARLREELRWAEIEKGIISELADSHQSEVNRLRAFADELQRLILLISEAAEEGDH